MPKPRARNRNSNGVRAVANSQMESVVTSHGVVMLMVSFCSFFVRDFVLVYCVSRTLRAYRSHARQTPHACAIVCTIYR